MGYVRQHAESESDIPFALLPAVSGLIILIAILMACAKRETRAKRMRKDDDVGTDRSKRKGKVHKPDSRSNIQLQVSLKQRVPMNRPPASKSDRTISDGKETLRFSAADVLQKAVQDNQLLKKLMIAENRLILKDVIGSGAFGLVYQGILVDDDPNCGRLVAVKTVYGASCTKENADMFIKESARMAGLSNRYILALLALTVKENKPCVILPYMENGDLRSYITATNRTLTIGELVKFGHDVARGMSYLADRNFIHRDLAARNCMVSAKGTVKVADFGLSRDLYQSDYYRMSNHNTPLPIRWIAIECILTYKFTIKSDVWSYGVLLWELMTRGIDPYPDIKDNVELIKFLRRGGRMECPKYVPSELSNLMYSCWKDNPKDRPEFKTICRILNDILSS